MAFVPNPFNFRTSTFVWNALDSFGERWRRLDTILRERGRHDRVLDRAVSSLRGRNVLHPFSYYPDGWGDITIAESFTAWLQNVKKEMETQHAARTWQPRKLNIDFGPSVVHNEGFVVREGRFRTCAHEIQHMLPKESVEARALFVSPKNPTPEIAEKKPTVILLAGTGEHGYGRRCSSLAIPLAIRAGISSVILESPFYGTRRPPNQVGSKLRRVSDLPVLGRVTIEETCSLLRYVLEEMGAKTAAVAGISMGGLHSAMSASLFSHSVGVVSWLGPPSAAPVFTEGLLSRFCEWKRLQNEVGNGALAKDVMYRFLCMTNIDNFPRPVDPSRGIFVIAEHDLYVPVDQSIASWHAVQQEKWRGSRVTVIPGGHVSATLFGGPTMRRCIEHVLDVRKEDPFQPNPTIV